MNILSIDSSTKFLSVAVSRDDKLLSEANDKSQSRHMVNIIGMVKRALSEAKLTLKEIDVFGVNSGPGDFTGTRIGISVIKMLSWLESKPAYGINSLDSNAVGICLRNGSYILKSIERDIPVMVMPCLDVRKSEVYFSFYEISRGPSGSDGRDNNGDIAGDYTVKITKKGEQLVLRKRGRSFLTRYDNLENVLDAQAKDGSGRKLKGAALIGDLKIIIGGNCYPAYAEVLSGIAGGSAAFILDKKAYSHRAECLNVCAYYSAVRKAETGNLSPVYVREFIPFGGGKG
jgi:tRNA threonylcarbamoyl adenosine modification protein YeaZ